MAARFLYDIIAPLSLQMPEFSRPFFERGILEHFSDLEPAISLFETDGFTGANPEFLSNLLGKGELALGCHLGHDHKNLSVRK
jgi:hypothetical protein